MLRDIETRGKPKPKQRGTPKGSLTIDLPVALLVRKVCRHEGYDITTFVSEMLKVYVRTEHPEWKITEDP
jgi:hypothetical protein